MLCILYRKENVKRKLNFRGLLQKFFLCQFLSNSKQLSISLDWALLQSRKTVQDFDKIEIWKMFDFEIQWKVEKFIIFLNWRVDTLYRHIFCMLIDILMPKKSLSHFLTTITWEVWSCTNRENNTAKQWWAI